MVRMKRKGLRKEKMMMEIMMIMMSLMSMKMNEYEKGDKKGWRTKESWKDEDERLKRQKRKVKFSFRFSYFRVK